MPRFPSAQGRLNHEPDSTLAVTKTCPKDGVHLSGTNRQGEYVSSSLIRTGMTKGQVNVGGPRRPTDQGLLPQEE